MALLYYSIIPQLISLANMEEDGLEDENGSRTSQNCQRLRRDEGVDASAKSSAKKTLLSSDPILGRLSVNSAKGDLNETKSNLHIAVLIQSFVASA